VASPDADKPPAGEDAAMTFPTVTEVPAKLEPLTRDTFGGSAKAAAIVAPVRRRIVD
jgi:hypothetical protein